MSVTEEVKQAAVQYFMGVLASSAGDNGVFKGLITTKIGGEVKPLLFCGTAHSRVEDGHCTAILNPDQDLVGQIYSSCSSNEKCFKEMVAKRCDLAMDVWVDAYKKDGVYLGPVYKTRKFKPAKFVVR